jgi:hypothetical protein
MVEGQQQAGGVHEALKDARYREQLLAWGVKQAGRWI